MSNYILTWVWQDTVIKGSDLLVLLAIADQASDDGIAWPAHKSIAQRTRLSRKTVQRALDNLRALGIIDWDNQTGTSNRYTITGYLRRNDMRQIDAPPNAGGATPGDAGGATPGDAGGATPGDALTIREPSKNPDRRGSAPSKGSQFPEDFNFSDVRKWTREADIPVGADEFEKFKDHHLSLGSVRKDWAASWRTWARRSKDYGPRRTESADAFGGPMYGVFR